MSRLQDYTKTDLKGMECDGVQRAWLAQDKVKLQILANTPRPCFMSICFMHFIFKDPYQFPPLPNLLYLIFSIRLLCFFIYIYLYIFSSGDNIFIYSHFFQESNYSLKHGLGV
jgi:hypothetical protein